MPLTEAAGLFLAAHGGLVVLVIARRIFSHFSGV